jgi:peroxiredoxin Q/BCP
MIVTLRRTPAFPAGRPRAALLIGLAFAVVAGLSAGCTGPAGNPVVAGSAGGQPTTQGDLERNRSMERAAAQRSPFVGRTAPDFTLDDQIGRAVTLSGLRGAWVVLYFYPKDDTPGCACQATEFTGLVADFQTLNAKVFGVSTDSVDSHREFVRKYNLKIELLSDPQHKAMASYGAWAQVALAGLRYERVIRSTVIIDPQGVVRYHWPEVIPQGHAQRVMGELALLQGKK